MSSLALATGTRAGRPTRPCLIDLCRRERAPADGSQGGGGDDDGAVGDEDNAARRPSGGRAAGWRSMRHGLAGRVAEAGPVSGGREETLRGGVPSPCRAGGDVAAADPAVHAEELHAV